MSIRINTLQKMQEQIKNESWNHQEHYFTDDYQEAAISIAPDPRVKIAKFIPDPKNTGQYLAHPDTIKAMRQNLLVAGEDLLTFEHKHNCEECKEELDLQFWKHCPFCGKRFPKDLRWND